MEAADSPAPPANADDVHLKIGQLTRQLHSALTELGYADQLRGTMGELPDAQSRLSYIARLTGEAAEKVLSRVEQAKAQHDYIASETRRVVTSLVADPVAAAASPARGCISPSARQRARPRCFSGKACIR